MRNSPSLKSNVEFRICGIEISGNSVIEMFEGNPYTIQASHITPSSNSMRLGLPSPQTAKLRHCVCSLDYCKGHFYGFVIPLYYGNPRRRTSDFQKLVCGEVFL